MRQPQRAATPAARQQRVCRGGRALVLFAAAALLTACGTTVPVTSQGSRAELGGPATNGGPLAGSDVTPGFAPSAAGPAGAGAGTQLGGALPAGPMSSGTTGVSSTTGEGVSGASPVVGSKAPIEIGVQTVDIGDGVAAVSAAGGCNADCAKNYKGVNEDTMARAAADWVNAHGGIAGHPIKMVVYQAKVSDVLARGSAAVAAEACDFWTRDHHVAALVLSNAVDDDWFACAAKNRIPLMNGDFANFIPDTQALRSEGGLYNYATADFNLDLIAKYYVNALADQGFLTSSNKIGLLSLDNPIYKRVVKNVLLPELTHRGLKLAASGTFTVADNTNQSLWTNYVLNFKTNGVDRVLTLGGWTNGISNFMKTAESQNYHPKYGMSSITGPNDLASGGQIPKAQLLGAKGMGWWPTADAAYSGDAGTFNAAAAQCKKIMVKAGQPWTSAVWLLELKFCDNFFLIKALADRAGSVTASSFNAAADRLGTAYLSPYMWKNNFRPGDHNAAMYIRNTAYDDGCSCFKYTAPMYMPHW